MFYLEIFELNFCGLNKNTRRNIEERELRETLQIGSININEDSQSLGSDIEIGDYYILSDDNSNEQKIEEE